MWYNEKRGEKFMIKKVNSKMKLSKILQETHAGDVLVLEDGIYQEKIEVWVPQITIRAEHPHKAILTNKDYAHKIMEDNNECNTFRTYTLYIGSNEVCLKDLVIQNEAIPSSIYGQAVALHVDGDEFICDNCIIRSAQDTLFTGPMPADLLQRYQGFYPPQKLIGNPSKQYYNQCLIQGDVDFIFGCATTLFEECTIETIKRNNPNASYVCAPSHPIELPFGYLFHKCKFIGSEPAYLARPWRDYGCAAFIECDMDDHILPEGYNKWNQTNRDKTARFFEYTPSKDLSHRVTWAKILDSTKATKYYAEFIDFLSFIKKK